MLNKLFLLFFFLATNSDKAEVKAVDLETEDGCYIDPSSNIKSCKDGSGNRLSTFGLDVLPLNSSCILENNKEAFNLTCHNGVNIISFPEDKGVMRIKRQTFTSVGAEVGGLFGPWGTVAGAGIGAVVDLVCTFLCHHEDPPPPNHPPHVEERATLSSTTPIMARDGETKAIVNWQEPSIVDPEDGELEVETYPNVQNGSEFSEGITTVYFKATDSGGLTVTDYLSFEVKVGRCGFPMWPENGNIDCHGATDIILGTNCSITCYQGFNLDEGATKSIKCTSNGIWQPPHIPNCKPRACARVPSISHGNVQCINNEMVYDNMCEAVCDDGFQVHGMHLMGCDANGEWGSSPNCKDVLPPRLKDCPGDLQAYIDSKDNTAAVTWLPPDGDDNSGENVTITEIHGYQPGQRFKAGSHTIKYTIEDKERNRGDSCIFTVEVLTISCSAPDLHVAGGNHLKYDCSDSFRLGAVCNLACKSGYPMGGATKIQCMRDQNVYPPTLNWAWEDDALDPFCKETNCSKAALNVPVNGALSCSEWTHGQMCGMQCNDGFDIPNIGDGQYVCGRSTGKWKPPGKVPDCNTKIDVNNMHLPNEFYYYTGKCNSSIRNLNQIKENFVNALNISKFQEECVAVPECQAKYVDVICGPTSSRRKRDLFHHFSRRSASQFAYVVHFELIVPYKSVAGKSPDDISADTKDLLFRMSDVIQKETDSGHFDLLIGDLHVKNDSYGPGTPAFQCPPGTIGRINSASCVGCPKGQYATRAGRCMECPIGTYQNSTNSLKCEACPHNTNTTETGAENITQCLEYCIAGEFSLNTLAPCTKCPSNSYQPNAKSSSCIKCGNNKRTSKNGATAESQCKVYDLQLNKDRAKIEIQEIYDVMTVFMWLYVSNANTEAAFEIINSTSLSGMSVKFTPTVMVTHSGKEVRTGQPISLSSWTNVAFSIDKPSDEFKLYINGKVVYKNATFVISKLHVLEQQDFIRLVGDIKVSAFRVLPQKASESEIQHWASTCTPAINGSLVSMDNFTEAGNVTVVIPSVCDAVNECNSSPCGAHKCLNKLGGYECLCTGGFTGQQCQTPPDFCKNNNCMNKATCINGTANYTCHCPHGFSGVLCSIKAVDGQWSGWTNWTTCSKTCGSGVATRARRCDSPPPDKEGNNCTGQSSESSSCKQEKCPECSRLRRTLGLSITCNETSEMKRCTISCRAGLYFTNPPLQYYECGPATGYKWNHQTEENPKGRLPSCSELQPPLEMGVDFDGHYDSIPCTDDGKKAVKDSLETKMSTIDCKKTGTCETTIQEPMCVTAKKKRATGSSMTVTVGIHASVNNKAGGLNIPGLLQNNTAPSKELLDLVKQTLELEKSAQILMNDSVDFFQVTIDGSKHSINPATSPLTYRPAIMCPSGTVRIEVFCAVCPVGSYSNGKMVIMCPRGQYQDTKGQSTCKQCPFGKTTAGIGSIHVSECSVSVTNSNPSGMQNNSDNGSDETNDAVKIGVGVSVSVSLLILAVVAAILLCKHYNKNKRSVNVSTFDLHTEGYLHMPSTSVVEKRLL